MGCPKSPATLNYVDRERVFAADIDLENFVVSENFSDELGKVRTASRIYLRDQCFPIFYTYIKCLK